MKTFEEVKNEVLRYGFNDGPQVNAARIEQWINEAQLQVARHVGAPEFQETANQVLTVGTSKYVEPASLLRYQSIAYPNQERRIKPVDIQTYDSYAVSEIQSPPILYTTFKTEFWLWPIPSVADTIQIRYIKRPARLVNPTDVPVLAEDYLHLLVDYSLARANRAEDDLEAANAHQQQYERDLKMYELDMMRQQDDRPRQLQGTWGG